MIRIRLCFLFVAFSSWTQNLPGQEQLALPKDEKTRGAVINASDWLIGHLKSGSLSVQQREEKISVIAWKDPTLDPEQSTQLAGYLITDNLWASYALKVTKADVAKEIHESLAKLDCLGNSLHEVIWRPIESICHKPADADIVHGSSIGILQAGESTVDLRTFSMTDDSEYTIGHPLLFAEHAVYQSLHEFRNRKQDSAKNRLRRIFENPPNNVSNRNETRHIYWNQTSGLLIDFVAESQHSKFINGQASLCRQYSFKLGVLLYACKLMGLADEYPREIQLIHQMLAASQLPSGGVSHYYDVDSQGRVFPGKDATGEATAIFMLAETVTQK